MNVYRKALNVLKERGWTKSTLEDENGACCVLGALYFAANEEAEKGALLDDGMGEQAYKQSYIAPLAKISASMYPDLMVSEGIDITDENDVQISSAIYTVNDRLGREAAETLLEKAAIMEEERVA